jgi:hypothetical protein
MGSRNRSERRAVDIDLCPPGQLSPWGWSEIALHRSVLEFASTLVGRHMPPLSAEQVAALSFLHAAPSHRTCSSARPTPTYATPRRWWWSCWRPS